MELPVPSKDVTLFDVFYPKEFEDENEKERFDSLFNDLLNLFQNKLGDIEDSLNKLEVKAPKNPFEEERKKALEKKQAKKGAKDQP